MRAFGLAQSIEPGTRNDSAQYSTVTLGTGVQMSEFVSGNSSSTQIGYINRNNQRCAGNRGIPGNEYLQVAYRIECLQPSCGEIYGSNGSDIFERKCPHCQGGTPGIYF